MENEKRMVGDYTVLCAVNIGSREIILAENEQSISRTTIPAKCRPCRISEQSF